MVGRVACMAMDIVRSNLEYVSADWLWDAQPSVEALFVGKSFNTTPDLGSMASFAEMRSLNGKGWGGSRLGT